MREREPGVWELRVSLGRDPLTQRKRQRSRTFHGPRRKAETALAALIAETAIDRAPTTEGTFGYLLAQWLRRADRECERTTAEEYRRIVTVTLMPALGTMPLAKLTGAHLTAVYDALLDRGLKPSSVLRVHACARRALNFGVKWGWCRRNVAADADPPTARPAEVEPPTVAQLTRLVAHATTIDPDFAVLLRVAAATGARRGELCALRWSDIDLTAPRVTIRRAVVAIGAEIVVKAPKTHANRRVSIDLATAGLVRAHWGRMVERARCEAPGGVLAADAYVWSREPDGGTPLRPDLVSKTFRRLADGVGVRGHLHDLRHLNISLQLAAGVPLAVVSQRAGHGRQSTTLDIYSHAMPAADGGAAGILGDLLGD